MYTYIEVIDCVVIVVVIYNRAIVVLDQENKNTKEVKSCFTIKSQCAEF